MSDPLRSLRLITSLLAVLAGAAIATAPHGTFAEDDAAKRNRFINLSIPEPWTDLTPTWILSATAEKTIVAQHSIVRDICVIEIEGDRRRTVGENGDAVTGLEGSILHWATQGADGRLFIMAEYPRLQRIRGNRFCLYVLEGDRWRPYGPRFGAPIEKPFFIFDHGVHFLGDNRPLTVSISPPEDLSDRSRRIRLRRIEGEDWFTLPGFDHVYDDSRVARLEWRKNDACFIEEYREEEASALDVRWLEGPDPKFVSGPVRLGAWMKRMSFFHFAVSAEGAVAVYGMERVRDVIDETTPKFVKIYHPTGDGGYKLEEAPAPGDWRSSVDAMGWSPTGVLHAVHRDGESVAVHAWKDGRWKLAGTGTAAWEGSLIMNPKLHFRPDGTPLVVWENFIPAD